MSESLDRFHGGPQASGIKTRKRAGLDPLHQAAQVFTSWMEGIRDLIYSEWSALIRNSISGKRVPGLPRA